LKDVQGHIGGLRDYTYADGTLNAARLQRHLERLLRGEDVRDEVEATGKVARWREGLFDRENARLSLLDKATKTPVMLLAPRRTGKTSLMYWLLDDPPEAWAPIYLDLMWWTDPREFVGGLAAEVLRARALADRIIAAGEPFRSFGLPPERDDERRAWKQKIAEGVKTDWLGVLDSLLAATRGRPRPLLLLDEVADFIQALREGSEPDYRAFVEEALPMLSNADNCGLVVTGSRSLEYAVKKLALTEAFAGFDRFVLPPFEREPARVLFEERLRAKDIRPTPAVVDRAVSLVGHQVPYFVQMLADAVVNGVPAGDLADASVVEDRYRNGLLGYPVEGYFNDLERRLKGLNQYRRHRAGRDILCLVAEREDGIEDAELVARFQESAGGAEAFEELMVLLEEYFFLGREGARWRFQVPVMRDCALKYYRVPNRETEG
jgi:hypothetical protein